MTDEQINATIAKEIGWTQVEAMHRSGRAPGATYVGREFIPDYCIDLNAMHQAEEQMDEIDWVFFMTELAGLVRLPKQAEVQIKQLVHSTARHRAQALLKTLGKWEEVQG